MRCASPPAGRRNGAPGSSALPRPGGSFGLGARKQHAGFDLGQHCGHDQIFGRQLQIEVLHHVHVLHVLGGDGGDGYVQDVQVLALDQVQQQVQRALKGLGQEDLQCVRRDIQILGQAGEGYPLHHGKGHFLLFGGAVRLNFCHAGLCYRSS